MIGIRWNGWPPWSSSGRRKTSSSPVRPAQERVSWQPHWDTRHASPEKLLGALKVAKAKGTIEAELRKIERCPLLILDDLFLVPLDAKERALLLDIIEDRHGRKSIIITSQVPVSNWYDAIEDPTVADAVLDRIVHSAHQIELTGESVRKIKAGKNK